MHGLLRWQGLALSTGLGHLHEGLVDGLRGGTQVSPGHGLTLGFLGITEGFSFFGSYMFLCSYVYFFFVGGLPPNDLGIMLFFVLKNVMLTWEVHSISEDCLNRIVASMFYISRRQDVGGV